jgi:hypothetical protein
MLSQSTSALLGCTFQGSGVASLSVSREAVDSQENTARGWRRALSLLLVLLLLAVLEEEVVVVVEMSPGRT